MPRARPQVLRLPGLLNKTVEQLVKLNHRDHIGRHERPCVHLAKCARRIIHQIDGNQIDGRSLPSSANSRLAWSVLTITTGSRGGTSCSTTVNLMIPLHPAKPTGTYTTPIGCVTPPMPLADSGFSWLHSNLNTVFRKQFAPFVQLLFPDESLLGTSVQQDFSRTSATNVQEAPRKKGLRAVGPATVMNPFEFSSGFAARRSYLSSLRCPRFHSGHSRAPCPSLRHLAQLARSFSC